MSALSKYDPDSRSYDLLYGGEQSEKLDALLATGWRPGSRTLDIGCGTSLLTHRLAKCSDLVIGLDLSLAMLGKGRRRNLGALVLGDASFLPFRGKGFDTCVCFTSFHNFRGKAKALKEAIRVLRRRGWLAFSLLQTDETAHDRLMLERSSELRVEGSFKAGKDLMLMMRRT